MTSLELLISPCVAVFFGALVYTCRKLIERANDWLQLNVAICQVLRCETVTWCAVNSQSLGDSEQMALSTSIAAGTKTFYLRGLRSRLTEHYCT